MSRLNECFRQLRDTNRKALIVYIVPGDPVKSTTVPLLHAMVAAGANVIELGVPFSDPEAEGPVIQMGHERALQHGTSMVDVFEMVREFRTRDDSTPVIFMGYLNPIEVMGYEKFGARCEQVGVDGTIIVNLPPEEGELLTETLRRHQVDSVYLVAPTTTRERAEMICDKSEGFVYYVSLKGVTGAGSLDVEDVRRKLEVLKGVCKLPIAVGFGIKDGESARAVAELADGVVVGTAIVELVGRYKDEPDNMLQSIAALLADIRAAIDRPRLVEPA